MAEDGDKKAASVLAFDLATRILNDGGDEDIVRNIVLECIIR
jgi:hypothetical protein